MSKETKETWAIALGLASFGLATGSLTGLSLANGASIQLLTSVFTFAGGALLTYSAIQRVSRKADGAETVTVTTSAIRIGTGLAAMSLLLVVGLLFGMWIRYRDPLGFARSVPCASTNRGSGDGDSAVQIVGVNHGSGSHQAVLERIEQGLRADYYAKAPAADVLKDLRDLAEEARACAGP